MEAHHALTKRVRHRQHFLKRFLPIFLIAGYAIIGCADDYPQRFDLSRSAFGAPQFEAGVGFTASMVAETR